MRVERPQGYQPIFKGKKEKTPPYIPYTLNKNMTLDRNAKLAYLVNKYKG